MARLRGFTNPTRRIAGRRWNPALHPRNPRNGRFVERLGGGRAVTAAMSPASRQAGGTSKPPAQWEVRLLLGHNAGELKRDTIRVHEIRNRNLVRDPESGRWGEVYGYNISFTGGTNNISIRDADFVRHKIEFDDPDTQIEIYRPIGPLDPVTGEAAKRMNRWRRDAQRPARTHPTRREIRLPELKQDLQQATEELERQQELLRARELEFQRLADRLGFRGRRRQEYLDTNLEEARVRITASERQVRLAQQTYDYVASGQPDSQLDQPDPFAPGKLDESLYDPKRPLAIYGDMLQIGGGQAAYTHLAELEKIPPEMHLLVARKMAANPFAQAVVGGKSAAELGLKATSGPKGDWGPHHTWHDVDGAYNPSERSWYVGYTDNTISKGYSAGPHEFGHALDHALGNSQSDRAANTPEWQDIYTRAVRHTDGAMNPHFLQEGSAGRQELWAESHHWWSMHRGDRDAQVVHLMDRLLRAKLGNSRALAVAGDIVDYFDRIAKEATG